MKNQDRSCPVCHTSSMKASVFMEENIDTARLSALSFASRKTPEFMCHRLLRCPTCKLVYASNPPDQCALAHAYHESDFDSTDEANDAAEAYIRVVHPIIAALPSRMSALEIGTGTGIFLEKLKAAGFDHVTGVEPSVSAIKAAPPDRRAWIKEGIFKREDFQPDSFDLICCFMTMEHVHDPMKIAQEAIELLRPGGALVLVTHDYHSWINRLLGKRSPIIDIEHMQLFSKDSILELLERSGYAQNKATSFSNRYSLQYWVKLMPIPSRAKQMLISALQKICLADRKIEFNVGNMVSHGFKPR